MIVKTAKKWLDPQNTTQKSASSFRDKNGAVLLGKCKQKLLRLT